MFDSQMGLKPLARLCHRLAISTEAGIDVRKIWEREAASGPSRYRDRLAQVRDGVAAGESVADAVDRSGELFPKLFHEMLEVGEKSGNLAEVFRRLTKHYEHRSQMRRIFLAGITWPMLQLAAAIAIIGLVILIMGILPKDSPDILGFGLRGVPGLTVYMIFIGLIGAAIFALILAMQRGMLWTRPLQHAVMRIPVVGDCLRTIALSRMAWTLQLTLNVEMSLQQVLPLALRSTGSDHFIRHRDQVVADVVAGREIHEAFRRTGAFPDDFLDAVEVGEHSGQLVESMGRLSTQYEEQARAALVALTAVSSFAVLGLVAILIILMIFKIFSVYLNAIYENLP